MGSITRAVIFIVSAITLFNLGGCSAYERFLERSSVYFVTYTDQEIERVRVGYAETLDPPTISRTGYTFEGWYEDDSFSVAYDETEPIVEDLTLYAKWVPNSYEITFVIDDQRKTIPMEYGNPLDLEDVTKTGYDLVDLFTDAKRSDRLDDWTVPARDATYYTSWERSSFALELKLPDGTLLDRFQYRYEESLTIPEVDVVGHEFLGWYLDPDLSEPFNVSEMPANDLTVYGSYRPLSFTVDFETGDGPEISSLSVEYGQSIPLEDPHYSGHVFLGWYLDPDYQEPLDFMDMPARDLTLYARYEPATYQIFVHLGTGEDPIIFERTYESPIGDLDIPERTGFTFDGWFLDEDFDKPFNHDRMPDHDLDIYARWERNEYTIDFVVHPHDPIPSLTFRYEQEIALDRPTLIGHTFDGWFMDEEFEEEFTLDTMPAQDIELYAKFSPIEYRISVHSLDNEIDDVIPYLYDEPIADFSVPDREGFTFSGWYLDEDYSEAFDYERMPDHDIDVYAKWTRNNYTVFFETEPHPDVPPIDVPYEGTVDLPTLTLEGHSFIDWFHDSDFQEPYAPEPMPANDLTLYAKFQVNEYEITVYPHGSETAYAITFQYGEAINGIETPERIGHEFEGWFLDETLSDSFDYETMPARDLSLYPKWSINSYTLSFETGISDPISDRSVLYDEELTLPEPTVAGYEFQGWYLDADRTTPLDFETMPAYDLTLYAHFLPNTHTLSVYTPRLFQESAAGFGFTISLSDDGHIYSAGKNNKGQLGNGTDQDAFTPVDITEHFDLAENETIAAVAAGWSHGYALSSDGNLFSWGNNLYGQLGNGNTKTSTTPIDITSNFDLYEDEEIISVESGYYHGMVLTSEGRVMTWGINYQNELGDGTATPSVSPVDITPLFSMDSDCKIISIESFAHHSFALSSCNGLYGWGKNTDRQLGIDSSENQPEPIRVDEGLDLEENETPTMIGVGFNHTFVLTSNDRLFAFGDNSSGQLGLGSTDGQPVPRDISPLLPLQSGETIASIFAGNRSSAVLTSQQRMLVFGNNSDEQLQDHNSSHLLTPLDLSESYAMTRGEYLESITIGMDHVLIHTSAGRMFAQGSDSNGQLMSTHGNPVLIHRLHSTLEVDYSSSLETLIPQWDDFTFDRWYTDSQLTERFSGLSMPDHDLELYITYALLED